MMYSLILKESRAKLLVKEMQNNTKIVSEPDEFGWVRLEVEVDTRFDILSLYHAGMEAQRVSESEWRRAKEIA